MKNKPIKIRKSWKAINPVTRIVPNKKNYDRNSNKKETRQLQKEEEI